MIKTFFKGAVLLLAAGLCAWFAWTIVVRSTVRFGAVAVSDPSGNGRLAYGYGMTLVGVALGSAYRYLDALRKSGVSTLASVPAMFAAVFKSVDFWLGICGSPLVYALLLRATDGGSNAGLTAIAIENGFFCTIIVGGLSHKQTQAAGRQTAPKPRKPGGS